jgi:hypothetical protein
MELHLEEFLFLQEISFHTLHGIAGLDSWYVLECLKLLQLLLNFHHLHVFHT